MDTLSQITLGAAIAGVVAAKPLGRKAVLWGGFLGTLPDFDNLFPFPDPVSAFTYHRGASHSLIILTLVAPLIAWLLSKLHKDKLHYKQWWLMVWLCLITHPLLDAFTVYGTQIWWPIPLEPAAISSIFIIDPLYTLPLLFACIALMVNPKSERVHRVNQWGLMLSTAYLCLSFLLQQYVINKTDQYVNDKNIEAHQILVTPVPFTIAAWRVVVVNYDKYYEGYYGLVPNSRDFGLTAYDRHLELLNDIDDYWAVDRLQWFTKGFYALGEVDNKIFVTDLRMGQEPNYAFSFIVAERQADTVTEILNKRHFTGSRSIAELKQYWCDKILLSNVNSCH